MSTMPRTRVRSAMNVASTPPIEWPMTTSRGQPRGEMVGERGQAVRRRRPYRAAIAGHVDEHVLVARQLREHGLEADGGLAEAVDPTMRAPSPVRRTDMPCSIDHENVIDRSLERS